MLVALSKEQLAAESEIWTISQADSGLQTLVNDEFRSIGQDNVEVAAKLYSNSTPFTKPSSVSARPSAFGDFADSALGLATPTPPADSVLASPTILSGTSSDLTMAAQSPTELGFLTSYAKGVATPTARLRYRGFIGRYRGAMPFIA
jgi:hypothetical protein